MIDPNGLKIPGYYERHAEQIRIHVEDARMKGFPDLAIVYERLASDCDEYARQARQMRDRS